MIEWVHVQMAIWGRWVNRGVRHEVGFPSVCPMFRDARFGGAYGSAPPSGVFISGHDYTHDVNQAVSRLQADRRRVCVEYYVIQGRVDDIAQRLAMSKKRLYESLHSIQAEVLGYLNDSAADEIGG